MVVLQASLGVSQSESDQVWDVERDLARVKAAHAVEEELRLLGVTKGRVQKFLLNRLVEFSIKWRKSRTPG